MAVVVPLITSLYLCVVRSSLAKMLAESLWRDGVCTTIEAYLGFSARGVLEDYDRIRGVDISAYLLDFPLKDLCAFVV